MDTLDSRMAMAARCVGRWLAALVVVLALGVVPGNASVADVGLLGVSAVSRNQPGQDKETLCHNGQTITVAEPAVQAHTGHGDTLGACEASDAATSDQTLPGEDDAAEGRAEEKVDLCHNGQTITVAEPAVQAHTEHGDALGACPAQPIATYQVDVECAADAADTRTTCAFAGMADETAAGGGPDAGGEDGKDVSVVVVPEAGVCTEVVGGEHEYVDPDPNVRVSGYKSRGTKGMLTLVLSGTVTTGGETIYWLKVGDKISPALGPALRCAPAEGTLVGTAPESRDATILVTALRCRPEMLPATADWYADCQEPGAETQFVLAPRTTGQPGPEATRTTDASGQVRFDRLPPGTYHLRPIGPVWCRAESDSVDAVGDVVVRAGQNANVWVFYCTGK